VSPRIESITVSDFRSIRGSITIPLDAPVVLIHGPNGVGKTSILSAMELAITGEVPSLQRVEPGLLNPSRAYESQRSKGTCGSLRT
jgi:exonuclease SbcC